MAAFDFDHHTESSGTAIVEVAPPKSAQKPRLIKLVYTPAGTAHDIIVMRAIGLTASTTADVVTATVVDVASTSFGNSDTIAANDWLVIEHADGTYGAYKVSSVASLAVTLTTGLTKATNAEARIWVMGAPSDLSYHSKLTTTASTRNDFPDLAIESGYHFSSTISRDGFDDPLLIFIDNATAAGTLNYGGGIYVGI